MALMDAKNLASSKLRPIKKIFKKYPTLLKNKNFLNFYSFKDFTFESQV
jgi:hypothetical protein